VLNVHTMMKTIQQLAGKDEEFNHEFFLRVKQMIDSGDKEGLQRERIVAKLI